MRKALYKASISTIFIDAGIFAFIYFLKMNISLAFFELVVLHLIGSLYLHQYFIINYYTEYIKKKKKEK